jgi:hypothetical protein
MDEIEKLKADLAAKEEELRIAKEAEGTAKASLGSTVEEIKQLREKKQAAEAERDLALAKLNGQGGDDVKATVHSILAEEKSKEFEKVRDESLEDFKNTHKELFAEANDAGGIKFEAFKKHLAKLNLSGLTTAKQLKEAYEDALILMNKGKTQSPANGGGGSPFTPNNSGGNPHSEEGSQLDASEQKLIQQIGWTEEKYLEQKKKRPSYVANLLRGVN